MRLILIECGSVIKLKSICLLPLSFLLILYVCLTYSTYSEWRNISHKCYYNNYFNEHIDLLEDILASNVQPEFGKSIFFHETSCKNGIVSINARQACAIESAARANPTTNVFVLFASPVGFIRNETKSPIIQALLSYTNVRMHNLNVWSYARDTPLNELINSNKVFRSKYLTSHLSDILRYLSLYKWGGTYLDLDVIVQQNLNNVENYAAAESVDYVAAGVMNFDNGGIGNHIALECLNDLKENFDGESWGNNGPMVITRVLKKLCKQNDTSLMTRDRCHGFLVLKPTSVYAIHFRNWNYFFDEKYTQFVLKATNDSLVVHVWNKFSSSKSVRVGSNVAYGLMASTYCPKVYKSCGDYF